MVFGPGEAVNIVFSLCTEVKSKECICMAELQSDKKVILSNSTHNFPLVAIHMVPLS